jgi:hypothetical protein
VLIGRADVERLAGEHSRIALLAIAEQLRQRARDPVAGGPDEAVGVADPARVDGGDAQLDMRAAGVEQRGECRRAIVGIADSRRQCRVSAAARDLEQRACHREMPSNPGSSRVALDDVTYSAPGVSLRSSPCRARRCSDVPAFWCFDRFAVPVFQVIQLLNGNIYLP